MVRIMSFETKNLDGKCLKWSKTQFQKLLGFGHYNFYAFWNQKLFFLVFMGGFFGFLGAPERNFKDFSCLNTFMGGFETLYYYGVVFFLIGKANKNLVLILITIR
jgi:hypothetical protein